MADGILLRHEATGDEFLAVDKAQARVLARKGWQPADTGDTPTPVEKPAITPPKAPTRPGPAATTPEA